MQNNSENIKKLKQKSIITYVILFCGLFLTACGSKQSSLESYRENMEDFAVGLSQEIDHLNNLEDTGSAGQQEVLAVVDEINNRIGEMSQWEIPSEFSSISALATEAAQNYSQAAELYHQLMEHPEECNESHLTAAHEYSSRAFKRIEYIGTILQGQLPEDEDVTIISDDPHSKESEDKEVY